MANIDSAYGLRPVNHPSSVTTGKVEKMYINASYGTALFVGEAVTVVAGGSNAAEVKSGLETHPIGSLREIQKTAAGDGNAITGVIVGFEQSPTGLEAVHSPASTEGVALVITDPAQVYSIQADGAVPASSVGLNAVLIDTNPGSTVTGLAGTELDTTSDAPAADASNQLTIVGISKNPLRNDVSAANTEVLVRINNSTEAHGVVGI